MPANLQQQLAGFTPYQLQGLQGMGGAAGMQAPLGAAGQQMALDTLGGKYLDPATNPYLTATYNEAARGLTDQYTTATAPGLDAAALRANAFGGSGAQEEGALQRYDLGQNLASLANQIYGGNYQQERQNQMAEQGLIPGLQAAQVTPSQTLLQAGTIEQQQQQQAFDTQLQNALRQFQYPQTQLEEWGSLLGSARGPAAGSMTVQPNRAGWLK